MSSTAFASSRDHGVEAARGDEGVDEVVVRGRATVELDDAAVRVKGDGGLGIVRRGERDEPRLVVALGEAVQIDRPLVQRLEPAEAGRDFAGRRDALVAVRHARILPRRRPCSNVRGVANANLGPAAGGLSGTLSGRSILVETL